MHGIYQEILYFFNSTNLNFLSISLNIKEFSNLYSSFIDFSTNKLLLSGNQITGKLVLEHVLIYIKKIENLSLSLIQERKKIYIKKINAIIPKIIFLKAQLEFALMLSENDLSCLSDNHERKIALKNITTTRILDDIEAINKQIKGFSSVFDIIKSTIKVVLNYRNSLSRNLLTGFLIFYYSKFAKEKTKINSKLFEAYPNIEMLKMLWGVTDSILFKKISPKPFPLVTINKMIFIPRQVKVSSEIYQNRKLCKNNQLTSKILPQEYVLTDNKLFLAQDSLKTRIPVQILSSVDIPLLNSKNVQISLSGKELKGFDKIIIYAHGGGFVTMSSFSCESYTRVWADTLNVPIFSIDYCLAPENPFPMGLHDVWQAYMWIIKYSDSILGGIPNKIILVGDSAGGNLVTSLTIKAISEGFRVPDGLLLIYPGMNLQEKYFSKSTLISLKNHVLPYSYYKLLAQAYVQNGYSLDNYLISPLLCPNEILKSFPRTELMITLNDPLEFDTFRFAEKLLISGVKAHITEYPNIGHGAICLGNKNVVPLLIPFNDDCCKLLSLLLG